MTAAHYKGGHPPGNDLGLHYTALPPIVASCPYSDQLLVTRKFWSPGANRPSQASAFGIEPREPFGNPLLLLSNLVHRSHLLYPFSSLDTEDDVIAPVFSMEKCVCCFDDYHSEPLSMSAGIADKLAPIFLNMKMMPFYDEPDRDAAIDTLRHAREIDADFLDTSDAYGQGRNEELIAHAVKGHRDEYVIASKFGNLRAPDGSPISDGRPEYVKACCERSLKRFETDASTSITSIVSTRPCRSRTPSE